MKRFTLILSIVALLVSFSALAFTLTSCANASGSGTSSEIGDNSERSYDVSDFNSWIYDYTEQGYTEEEYFSYTNTNSDGNTYWKNPVDDEVIYIRSRINVTHKDDYASVAFHFFDKSLFRHKFSFRIPTFGTTVGKKYNFENMQLEDIVFTNPDSFTLEDFQIEYSRWSSTLIPLASIYSISEICGSQQYTFKVNYQIAFFCSKNATVWLQLYDETTQKLLNYYIEVVFAA